MTKRMILVLIFLGVLFGGIFGFQAFKAVMTKKFMASQGIPPQTVSTTTVSTSPWQRQVEVVGSLQAVNGADLAPEVSDPFLLRTGGEGGILASRTGCQ